MSLVMLNIWSFQLLFLHKFLLVYLFCPSHSPSPLSLQILQVAIQIFISLSLLLINKRGLSSNTMLFCPMLICTLILFIILPLSHCSWPLTFHWNECQNYHWHLDSHDLFYCPHLFSILGTSYLYFHPFLIYRKRCALPFFWFFVCCYLLKFLLPPNLGTSGSFFFFF